MSDDRATPGAIQVPKTLGEPVEPEDFGVIGEPVESEDFGKIVPVHG